MATTPRKPLSRIVEAVPPSGIRKFFDLAQTMSGVISLGVGEPDFPTPWGVREAAIHALEHGATTYTSNSGLLELRELICADLATRYGTSYRPADECLITSGVSEGLDLTLRALLNPGDEVIVPEPCYVAYQPCVAFAGGVPVPVAMDPAEGYRLDADRIAAAVTPRTKAVLFGSPSNPTGAAQSARRPRRAGRARRARGPLAGLRRDLRPADLRRHRTPAPPPRPAPGSARWCSAASRSPTP